MQSSSNTESIGLQRSLNDSSVSQGAFQILSEDNSETCSQDSTQEQDEEETDNVERAYKRPRLPGTRALFTKHHHFNSRSSFDVFAEANKQARGRIKNYNYFRCGSLYHRHSKCSTSITHPAVINRSGKYAKFLRKFDEAEEQASQREGWQILQQQEEILK